MNTLHVTVTDAEIRKQAAGNARQLRDPRYPELRFRYSTSDRAKGAWHVVVRGKWGKAGNYPGINAKLMQSTLPAILARRAVDPDAVSTTSSWRTVGDVLSWYTERMKRDRALSAKRKAGAESALRCHLVPRLQEVELCTFNGPMLDRLLMWPMQERYKASFVRLVYGVLAVAFSQALRLKMLPVNPMATLKFTDFIATRIRPKPARVRGDDLPALMVQLAEKYELAPTASMLALMMLCHGTRLGETRLARWKNINLTTGLWFIPEEDTKTKAEHTLPLTAQACALLKRYRDQQHANGYTGPHVFPGRPGAPVSASKASTLFAELAKGEWSSHDLRKVARTGWADLGVDYMVGEMLLNHAMKDLDATYIHTTAEGMKRKALETWHDHLDSQGFRQLHGGT
ncbi:tyrosine-type recombinase/integrase [Pseudomonas viridiflava]|uniref:tyrosine-type recombinase/integrase n=1 Tax=Pseudomonas syringae group TaxID=136849 RepID=UPI0006B67E90|nr:MULTISPECIES: site-specific integrase [Pseudomonas syringae group]KPB52927.1 Integrase family protein [Pseudomonas coronafaciens pv. oryzae]MBD8806992.1 site-specific integrase [Pseudomonas syringae]